MIFLHIKICLVKRYYACPICREGTCSLRLKHGAKNIYHYGRRFLPEDHSFRNNKNSFYNGQEFEMAPKPLTGEEIFTKLRKYLTF